MTAWQADATAQVRWAITTTLNSTALNAANTAAASIVNTPVLTVNDATPKTGTPATVKVGDIKLVKQDAVSGNPLPNDLTAQFSVYRTEADAQARTNPISINGTTVFTTTAGTGALTISGLLFSDYVDGATVSDPAAYRSYWVNEVTAPTGYQLLADPIQVDVTAAGSDSTVIAVGNVPNTGGFVLPLTGGSGTAALTIGGVAILGIVLIVAVRRRASGNATK